MITCHLSAIMGSKRLKIADVVRNAQINRNTVTRLYHQGNRMSA
ncbi:helix-turn-helix domain-containing protein [Photobacterium phosphoreum]